jgi:hypothetical protein
MDDVAAGPTTMADAASTAHMHPYFPRSVELPGYVPPTMAFELVLACFFAACGAVMLGVWLYSGAFIGDGFDVCG